MPYFPYSRQSKKKSHRGAITARMIANLLDVAGVDHVITIDLHASQMQGFFKCPVDNLFAEPLLARWIKMNVQDWREGVVVSKNPGGTKRVTSLADALKLSFGIITTERRRPQYPHSMNASLIFDGTNSDVANGAHHEDTPEKESEPEHAPPRESTPEKQGESSKSASGRARARTTSNPHGRRVANGEAAVPPSPLAKSTRPPDSPRKSRSPSPEPLATFGKPLDANDADVEDEDEDEEHTDEVCCLLHHFMLRNANKILSSVQEMSFTADSSTVTLSTTQSSHLLRCRLSREEPP